MLSKMKKMFVALVAVAALAVPQLSAQQQVAAKYVDQDGFILTVKDGGYIIRWLEDIYNAGTVKLVVDPQFSIADKIIREIWTESNISQIGTTAVSGKQVAPDFYSVKSFVEMPESKRTGSLWKISQRAQTLDFLNVMPKNTIAAFGVDLDGAELLAMLNRYINKFGTQQVKNDYNRFLAQGRQAGVDVVAIANSIQGVALCVEADPARLIVPGYSSATLYVSVKDRTLMNTLVQNAKAENPEIVTANNELMIPTPYGMVTVFQQGNYIVATTDFAGTKNLLAGKSPSLKQNPDFIKYSAGTPAVGDAFIFFSSEIGKSVIPAYLPLVPAEITQRLDIQKLCNAIGVGPALYAVSYANRDGVGSICNTGSKGAAILTADPAMGSAALNYLSSLLIVGLHKQGTVCDFPGVE